MRINKVRTSLLNAPGFAILTHYIDRQCIRHACNLAHYTKVRRLFILTYITEYILTKESKYAQKDVFHT